MKVLSLIGARPQFIKEAILYRRLEEAGIQEVIVNSGQHYDFNMSDVFFEALGVRTPDYNLNVGSGSHGQMTGKIIIDFEKIVEQEKPDLILVFGDTNTTLAGAIVASKLKVKIGHIEAGVRMEPKDMPEEINRKLTDHASDILFCATKRCVENLAHEGITRNVHQVGDVMYDLFKVMEKSFKFDTFDTLGLTENGFVLVTIHRDYNVDTKETLEPILRSLDIISRNIPVVFPMHPRTKKRIGEFKLQAHIKNLEITEPLDYLDFMGLVVKCSKVITDSGGLQKESYFAGKVSIVCMPFPAWPELVDVNVNILSPGQIPLSMITSVDHQKFPRRIFGDGRAGAKIVKIISDLDVT